jgi:hypothetical protein
MLYFSPRFSRLSLLPDFFRQRYFLFGGFSFGRPIRIRTKTYLFRIRENCVLLLPCHREHCHAPRPRFAVKLKSSLDKLNLFL